MQDRNNLDPKGSAPELKIGIDWYENVPYPNELEVVRMGRIAALALKAEDASLRQAILSSASTATSKTPEAGLEAPINDPAAPGITYWLFETTLVYIIFKAWIPIWHVRWDWETVQLQRKSENARAYDPSDKKERRILDLVVRPTTAVLGEKPRAYAFEAKWWNTKAGQKSIEQKDRETLDSWLHSAKTSTDFVSGRAFHLLFWWSDSAAKTPAEIKSARKWSSESERTLVYTAAFTTLGPLRTERLFVLDIVEVNGDSTVAG